MSPGEAPRCSVYVAVPGEEVVENAQCRLQVAVHDVCRRGGEEGGTEMSRGSVLLVLHCKGFRQHFNILRFLKSWNCAKLIAIKDGDGRKTFKYEEN